MDKSTGVEETGNGKAQRTDNAAVANSRGKSTDFEATKYPLKQNPALQRVGQCYFTELAHN